MSALGHKQTRAAQLAMSAMGQQRTSETLNEKKDRLSAVS